MKSRLRYAQLFVVAAVPLVGAERALAMVAAPPATSDGHRVMPIGQTFVGLAGGGIVGAALTFVALRPSGRDRGLERLLLHAVGVMVVVAAVVACVRG